MPPRLGILFTLSWQLVCSPVRRHSCDSAAASGKTAQPVQLGRWAQHSTVHATFCNAVLCCACYFLHNKQHFMNICYTISRQLWTSIFPFACFSTYSSHLELAAPCMQLLKNFTIPFTQELKGWLLKHCWVLQTLPGDVVGTLRHVTWCVKLVGHSVAQDVIELWELGLGSTVAQDAYKNPSEDRSLDSNHREFDWVLW